jgi:two-component sensor histidine kinase
MVTELAINALTHAYPCDRSDGTVVVTYELAEPNWSLSAPGSWCDPAGASPAQVRSSVCLVASIALWKATTTAKRTQHSYGVGY